jgi:hypothetical protein
MILEKVYSSLIVDNDIRKDFIYYLIKRQDDIIYKLLFDRFIAKLTNYSKTRLVDVFTSEINNNNEDLESFLVDENSLLRLISPIQESDSKHVIIANIKTNVATLNSLI